ncbi:MAG TPA: metalloregulator ArsR/SmtB family transcription factor, partial [Myxococcota bacterium]|nr:metalloregulator ArsR/SmtB family transcription factor [Myxococcota bacterium]
TRKRGPQASGRLAAESRGRDPRRELAEIDQVFKALAHPSRRHVLLVLHYRGGEMTAGEIASRFACTWPTTTRHLRVLEDAGLVSVEQEGRERFYVLERARLREVAGDWLAGFG